MATIGALVFEMSANVARLQQDMAKARSTVEGAMAGITSAASLAKTALAGIGVGASIAGFEQMIMGAIEGEAALHKLNLQTGISVELLSALRPVAKQAGTDLDTAAGMVNKLEKNMLSFAQTGGGKAADAFKQLGYSQADVQKGLKNMDAFLPEFAKRLMETGVGGEQAGLAMQLMAKGGAAALPFLKQLVETGELHAKVTGDQAEAAHQFEVNLVKLQGASNALKIQIANALIPSLNDITSAMVDARKAGEGFFGTMIEGAKRAMQAMMGWNTAGDLAKVNEQIVMLTDKWMGLEKMQGTRGISAERVAGVKAELDALIKKREVLEGIAKMEAPEKKKEDAKKPLAELDPKVKAQKEIDYDKIKGNAIIKNQEMVDAARAESAKAEDDRIKEEARLREAAETDWLKMSEADQKAQLAGWQAIMDEGDRIQTAIANRMTETTKLTKDQNSWARELGLTFTSAFENSVAKGKDLRTVLQGLVQDLQKIVVRNTITEPLGKAVSGAIGGSSGIAALLKMFGGGDSDGGTMSLDTAAPRASGGPVSGGTRYLVGEEGPELFVPSGNGTIIPNGAGGGNTVVQNITIHQAGATVQDMMAVLFPAMRGLVRGEISNQLRPGGVLT